MSGRQFQVALVVVCRCSPSGPRWHVCAGRGTWRAPCACWTGSLRGFRKHPNRRPLSGGCGTSPKQSCQLDLAGRACRLATRGVNRGAPVQARGRSTGAAPCEPRTSSPWRRAGEGESTSDLVVSPIDRSSRYQPATWSEQDMNA